nr:polysaccharide deacetylase family protein [Bacillus sp. 165]
MESPQLIPNIEYGTTAKKVAYLTFDDGPSINTMNILDILDRYHIKATFFVLANSTDYGLKGYREIMRRGHVIGLHSYDHNVNKIYRSKETYFRDVTDLEHFLYDHFRVQPNIIRLPGGSKNIHCQPSVMNEITHELETRGYHYFDWNVDSKDGISPYISQQTIIQSVLKGAEGKKEINVLLHDISSMKNTVKALPVIIEGLQKQGFTFEVISSQDPEFHL